MRFTFYSPVHFEPWDWRTPDETGIGGSETAVCEMARRLALRGHEVAAYAPIRDDCPPLDPGGARWYPLDAADFSSPGVWVLSRCPAALDHFEVEHPGQSTWLVCQDVDYRAEWEDGLTPDRSARLDRCLPLCPVHERYLLREHPELAGKMRLSTNGLRVDLIERIEDETRGRLQSVRDIRAIRDDPLGADADHRQGRGVSSGRPGEAGRGRSDVPLPVLHETLHGVARDPFRLVYTSSPDRGLPALLRIFRRAREFEPRLNLRAAYGFNNIDKCEGRYWRSLKAECERLMDQPGVTWLGRMPQPDIYREFLSAGIWCYPTSFTESSCCVSMEAQGCGAIPITNPIWALQDNVRHGIFIEGDPNDPLVEARYVGEILRLTRDLSLQEKIRAEMVPYSRERFDWSNVVSQYEEMAG